MFDECSTSARRASFIEQMGYWGVSSEVRQRRNPKVYSSVTDNEVIVTRRVRLCS